MFLRPILSAPDQQLSSLDEIMGHAKNKYWRVQFAVSKQFHRW
jgi:hypothetical protein